LETPGVQPALVIRATKIGENLSARAIRIAEALVPQPRLGRSADLPGELASVPVIDAASTDSLPTTVASHNLDFILCFDDDPLWDALSGAARSGLWRFRGGDVVGGRRAGLTEMALEKVAVPQSAPTVLRLGCLSAIRRSWTATRQQLYREMARWPAQVCAEILQGAGNYPASSDRASASLAAYRTPPGSTLIHHISVPWHAAKYYFERLFVQQTWGIGIINDPISTLLDSPHPSIQWLRGSSSPYRYLADPFGVEDPDHPGRLWLLCEEYDSGTLKRGRIVFAGVQDGAIVETVPLPEIDAGVHAAYPYLIRHDGELFCIPETAEAGGIDLYRNVGSPRQWAKVCRLVEGFPGVDTTAFQHEGRWWLATCSLNDGPYHNLFLFHSDSLMGPWQPHVGNPVKCDVRSARPAGTPFLKDQLLYRPAQDCSERYGGGIAINRVETLTPTAFRETVVARLAADPGGPFPHGTHTLSAAGRYVFIDGRKDFFDPFKQLRKQVLRRIPRMRKADAPPRETPPIALPH
jgi:hypothetical protein